MKKELKEVKDKTAKLKLKTCGTITCIHNIDNKCMLKSCELYERSLRQEY